MNDQIRGGENARDHRTRRVDFADFNILLAAYGRVISCLHLQFVGFDDVRFNPDGFVRQPRYQ